MNRKKHLFLPRLMLQVHCRYLTLLPLPASADWGDDENVASSSFLFFLLPPPPELAGGEEIVDDDNAEAENAESLETRSEIAASADEVDDDDA